MHILSVRLVNIKCLAITHDLHRLVPLLLLQHGSGFDMQTQRSSCAAVKPHQDTVHVML